MKIKEQEINGYLVLLLDDVPKGQLDLTNIRELKNGIQDIISAGRDKIVLDMEKITYIDSSVIGFIVDLFNDLRAKNGSLSLLSVSPRVHNILDLVNLVKFLPFIDSRDEIGK